MYRDVNDCEVGFLHFLSWFFTDPLLQMWVPSFKLRCWSEILLFRIVFHAGAHFVHVCCRVKQSEIFWISGIIASALINAVQLRLNCIFMDKQFFSRPCDGAVVFYIAPQQMDAGADLVVWREISVNTIENLLTDWLIDTGNQQLEAKGANRQMVLSKDI